MEFLNCVIYTAAIGVGSFILGRLMPTSWFREDRFPYRGYRWEHDGKTYQALGIRKWQNRVPDMSKIFPNIMQEKKMTNHYQHDLPIMIKETCIAEFIHVLLCIAGLAYIWLWPGMWGKIITVVYILANIPYILIQRYNRPRFLKLQEKLRQKDEENL